MRSLSLLLLAALLCAPACIVSVDDPPSGGQYSCDGTGQCPAGLTCDTASGMCRGDPTRALGAACTAPENCDSGECVGGICCASACPEQPANECGRTGACSPDGTGCVLGERGTECAGPSCADGMFRVAAVCDGAGSCAFEEPAPCPGNFACLDETSCRADCDLEDSHCSPGFFCHAEASGAPKVCRKRNLGEDCVGDADCASGACVGGFCCKEKCANQGAASCGQTGACELSSPGSADYGSCALYPAGTECRAQSCSNKQFVPAASCAGGGQACPPAPEPVPCPSNLACASTVRCEGSCLVNTHEGCPEGAWCRQAGDGTLSCQFNSQAPGEPCSATTDCAQGTCNNGICCAQAPCCRSRADCPADTHRCANVASCVNEDLVYACTSFTCVQSADTATDSCDGLLAASCNTLVDAVCPSSTCPSSCRVNNLPDDSLCDDGYYCSSTTCQLKKDDQVTCSTDHECKGGTCRSGYCCGDQHACCTAAGNCLPQCTSPTTCQGYTRECDRSNCLATSTPNDSACDYDVNPRHAFRCSDSSLFIKCNGAISQSPATRCANGCAAYSVKACTASSTAFCYGNTQCVGATLSSQCTNGVCSCATLEHGYCKTLSGVCPAGRTCSGATVSNGCAGTCR